MFKNLYLVLGLERNCSRNQIKKAYRRIAKQLHPDTTGCGADAEKFLEARDAYEILADDEKRRHYDKQLAEHTASKPSTIAPPLSRFRSQLIPQMPSLWSGWDNDLGGIFPFGTARTGRRPLWQDVGLDVVLTPRESLEGGLFTVVIPVQEPCPQCGPYELFPNVFCPICGGAGSRIAEREFALDVPPHTGHGTAATLDLEAIGLEGVRLHVQVRVDPLLADES